VHEAVQEALKLEAALARLSVPQRIVLMHYAPIRDTVEGEPAEIYPFLGSSRLEDPLSRFEVTAVFHGHAHKGAPEGRTQTGIPVYNVSYSVLKRNYADRPPFRLFEVRPQQTGDAGVTPIGERVWARRATDHGPAA
jgi:Icc-related predicted phosphoesterase